MKYIKKYENITNDEISVGDYVLVNLRGYSGISSDEFLKFINNNIGRIIKIEDPDKKFDNVSVEYKNVPEYVRHPWFRYDEDTEKIFKKVRYGRIITNSKNKEDIERILTAKKFNL